jgi:hypothetical protein
MCKEMLVIPVNRVVDKKRLVRKNGGTRRRSGMYVQGVVDPRNSLIEPKNY